MQFKDRLKAERERLGFNQTDFAELAKATRKTLFNWESGESTPNADALLAWAAAGADVEYILHGVPANEKAMAVMGVTARLIGLGYPPDTRPEALTAVLAAHPDIDLMWLLTGQAPKLDGELNAQEKILVTNYRAASEEGQKALRSQAAFFAQNNSKTPVPTLTSVKRKAA